MDNINITEEFPKRESLNTKDKYFPLTFQPLNPDNESPFLNYLLLKFKPKKESWKSKTSRKFQKSVEEEGELGDQGHVRSREREELVLLDDCGCRRKMMVETDDTWLGGGESTCSHSSYRRGGGQKVIGYSYYGERNSSRGRERKYFKVR